MNSDLTRGSFHEALKPVLKISQFFGVMPVDFGNSKDISSINFRWNSIKTIYCLVFLLLGCCESFLCLWLVINNGITLSSANSLSFYFVSMIGAAYFLKLAVNWKSITKIWYENEKVFLKPPYTMDGWSLNKKIRVWSSIYGLLAFGKKLIKILSIRT